MGTFNLIFVTYVRQTIIFGGGIKFWIYIFSHPIII
jgi:hypothetical protein